MLSDKPIFKIIVKPNSLKNEITGYDENRKAYRISIAAKAENNKANKEIINFLSKLLKKRVVITSGLTSRLKTIRAYQKD